MSSILNGKIILPVASKEGGEAVVPIVEKGDEVVVVIGPGTCLLHCAISNVNALEILKQDCVRIQIQAVAE